MNTSKKLSLLQRLLDQSQQIRVHDSNDPTFKTWKNTVERILIRVFGENAPEVQHFQKLRFFYRAVIMNLGSDYSYEHRQCFERDFHILISSIKNYIEELENDQADDDHDLANEPANSVKRVFISHSSKDVAFVEELIDVLESVGAPEEAIFCTSFAGYGIDLGQDFLETIKTELHSDTLVLFVLSENFYASPVCLCEMGATWVLT